MIERPTPDPASGPVGPLTDWITRFDEAIRRGETPSQIAAGLGITDEAIDLDRCRALVVLLNRTLRPGPPDSAGGGSDGVGETTDPMRVERLGRAAAEAGSPSSGMIGRFTLEEELGRGGFGVVFRAFDPEMGRRVALKIPRADALLTDDVRRQFLREAQAAARLDHPNLVPVFEAGEAGPICYIASVYCEGPSLRRWIDAAHAPTEPRRAARLAIAMARAIEHMHARGLLHCDLKPANVLLDLPDPSESDADPVPRITDFGLARLAEAPVGESTAAKAWGTPPYMAPEQLEPRRGSVGPPTDLYALGSILYELLTGRPPHAGPSVWELLSAVVSEPPTPPRRLRPSVPRDLDAIVLKCLEKRPERRYATAAGLADDLERYLGHRPVRARPLGPFRKSGRWASRNPSAAVLLGMGLVTLTISLAYATAMGRLVGRLDRANVEAREALEGERRHRYVATLTLAEQQVRDGRYRQAQRLLRELSPATGSAQPDPRDFAWHYLYRQSRRDRTFLDGLTPTTARYSVATAGGVLLGFTYQSLSLWSMDRPRPRGASALGPDRTTAHFLGTAPVGQTAFGGGLSPDGRLVISIAREGTRSGLIVLDASDRRVLADVPWPKTVAAAVCFAADGAMVGIGSEGFPAGRIARGTIEIGPGRRLPAIVVPEAVGLTFLTGGQRLAALRRVGPTGDGKRLELWDVRSGRRSVQLGGTIGPALAASPLAGGLIATATLEGVVQLRAPDSGAVVAELPGPREIVWSLAFSPDGRRLVAGGDRRATLWDVAEGRQVAVLEDLGGWVNSVAFVPGTPDIAMGVGPGEVVLWHVEPMAEATSPGGHADEAWGVAFSPDGAMLASVGGDRLVKLWDATTGRELGRLAGHGDWPSGLAFHPGGRLLASADYGGEVLVWDVPSRRLVRRLEADSRRVRALAFAPDGRSLATGGLDTTVRLWDTTTWLPVATLEGHSRTVRGLAFAPDGRSLVSAGDDGAILRWGIGERRALGRSMTSVDLTSVAYSPDGTLLASGDARGAVTLWDAADGSLRARLPALHAEEISALAFSPDGRVLAVAGQDGLVSLLDVATARHHLSLAGHAGGVNALDFSPDGRTLASASHDRSIRLWWAGPGDPGPSCVAPRVDGPRPEGLGGGGL